MSLTRVLLLVFEWTQGPVRAHFMFITNAPQLQCDAMCLWVPLSDHVRQMQLASPAPDFISGEANALFYEIL
jgi:hypothetical protein